MRVNHPTTGPSIASSDASAAKKTDKVKQGGYDSKAKAAPAPGGSDSSAEISSKAREMATAKQVATDAPDVREAKIAELREKILNKKYDVSADQIADKLVDDHMRMTGA
jgi:negative regulator of flagellin synthesis FlgM